MIGEKISPILNQIENTLWEFEAEIDIKPEYTIEGFRSGIKIFMSVMLDKMWELQKNENISQDDREKMAVKLGKDVRNLVRIYTNIDTYDLYKTK
jgi:hypothetical protein